jgi:hypothetical protein
MSHIEETNRALEEHLVQTKTRDVVGAVVCGLVVATAVYFLLATGGAGSSGGISPTVTERAPWPVFGALAGVVGGAFAGHAFYRHRRQQRRRRFWGLWAVTPPGR